MAYNSFILESAITTTVQATSNTTVLGYKISYTVGISPKTFPYILSYRSINLSTTSLKCTISYIKKYDDTALYYSIPYMVNREVIQRAFFSRLSYSTTIPLNNVFVYTVAYSFEKEITSKVLVVSFRYNSTWYTKRVYPYSLAYKTKGSSADLIRARYRATYNTNTVNTNSLKFRFKYNVSFFNTIINPYSLSYDTVSPDKVLTEVALLQTVDGRYDLFVKLMGSLDKQQDEYFYVFNNLPKYQMLEYTVDEQLPYLDKITKEDVQQIFDTTKYNSYQDLIYYRLKDVDPNNPIAVDVYTYPTYKKANKAKSYFFNLNTENNKVIDRVIQDERYVTINTKSDDFQYEYLNFTEVSITPIFNDSESCCFNQKILTPNSKISGGGCSPF